MEFDFLQLLFIWAVGEQIADKVVVAVTVEELPVVVVEVGVGLALDGAAQDLVAGTLAVSGVDIVILDF